MSKEQTVQVDLVTLRQAVANIVNLLAQPLNPAAQSLARISANTLEGYLPEKIADEMRKQGYPEHEIDLILNPNTDMNLLRGGSTPMPKYDISTRPCSMRGQVLLQVNRTPSLDKHEYVSVQLPKEFADYVLMTHEVYQNVIREQANAAARGEEIAKQYERFLAELTNLTVTLTPAKDKI